MGYNSSKGGVKTVQTTCSNRKSPFFIDIRGYMPISSSHLFRLSYYFSAVRYSLGDMPLEALKHLEKYLASANPHAYAISLILSVVVVSIWHALFIRASFMKSAGVTPSRFFVFLFRLQREVAVAAAISSTEALLFDKLLVTKSVSLFINCLSSSLMPVCVIWPSSCPLSSPPLTSFIYLS